MRSSYLIALLIGLGAATALPSLDLMQVSEAHAQAQEAVDALIQAGNDENACRTLANTEIKEIEVTVQNAQSALNAMDDGSSCPDEGQEDIKAAQTHKSDADQANAEAAEAMASAHSVRIQFPPQKFNSLTEGKCNQFFQMEAYVDAIAARKAAEDAAERAEGAAKAAALILATAEENARKAVISCQCRVKKMVQNAVTAATSNAAENQDSFVKAKHMLCVLEGTPVSQCETGEAPTLTAPALAPGVDQAVCSAPAPAPKPAGGDECTALPGQWTPIYCKVLHKSIEVALQEKYAEFWHEDYCSGATKTTCPMACNPACHGLKQGLPLLDHEKALFNEGAIKAFGGRTCCQDDSHKCKCCQDPEHPMCLTNQMAPIYADEAPGSCKTRGEDAELCSSLKQMLDFGGAAIDEVYTKFFKTEKAQANEISLVQYGAMLKSDLVHRVVNAGYATMQQAAKEGTLDLIHQAKAGQDLVPQDTVDDWARVFGFTEGKTAELVNALKKAEGIDDGATTAKLLKGALDFAKKNYCKGAFLKMCPGTCDDQCPAR